IEVENEIVRLRKSLADEGLDAGAVTIHWHLGRGHDTVPSVSSIWRVLKRRGFVTPQPKKRPRSSYIRFEAALPNECWQSDMTRSANECRPSGGQTPAQSSHCDMRSQGSAFGTACIVGPY